MRTIAAVLSLSLSLSLGCAAGVRSKPVGYVTGGLMAAIGAALIVRGLTMDCSGVPIGNVGCGIGKSAAPVLGVLIGVPGLAGIIVTAASPTPLPDPTPDPAVIVERLVAEAGLAARAGNCTVVRVLASRIDELDGSRARLAADPAIAACL